MKHLKLNKKKSLLGFTIIELLAVIVIIAIVATITLVVYTGITKNAYELSLKSDLSGASETLKTFKATHGSYPATIDCSAGETTTNTCVKSSNGNTYTSYVSTSTTFSLIEKNNPSGLIYIITESTDAMAYVEPVTTVSAVSAGGDHTCAVISNGRAYCWGNNSSGQLGNNSTTSMSTPVAVDISGALNGLTIKYISSGYDHTCAIASDGRVYCWGHNDSGQLGNNSKTNSSTPVAVDTSGALNGLTIKYISAGYSNTCVIASNDRAYCWGYNAWGQLGNNSTTSMSTPVAVDTSGALNGLTVKAISVGTYHTCAIASNNNAYCWGNNDNGQLGNNSTTNSLVPAAVQKTW